MILGLNLVTGLVGYTPGVESAGIAWEAHAFGYLAGLLLIGPLYKAFGGAPARPEQTDSTEQTEPPVQPAPKAQPELTD